jgi:hypothetical protein
MAGPVHVLHLERLVGHDGRTLKFFHSRGSRARGYYWFDLDEVPAFDEASAWFRAQRDGGRWVFLERVRGPLG